MIEIVERLQPELGIEAVAGTPTPVLGKEASRLLAFGLRTSDDYLSCSNRCVHFGLGTAVVAEVLLPRRQIGGRLMMSGRTTTGTRAGTARYSHPPALERDTVLLFLSDEKGSACLHNAIAKLHSENLGAHGTPRREVRGVLTAAIESALLPRSLAMAEQTISALPSDKEVVSGIWRLLLPCTRSKGFWRSGTRITLAFRDPTERGRPGMAAAGGRDKLYYIPWEDKQLRRLTKQWMLDFRAGDLDRLVGWTARNRRYRRKGRLTVYPYGRFAHLQNPEGNLLSSGSRQRQPARKTICLGFGSGCPTAPLSCIRLDIPNKPNLRISCRRNGFRGA